jgi:hypothetical protein
MINLGLHDDQTFPTEAHEQVACNLALCNPNIRDRDSLMEVVQYVITIPNEQIETITFGEMPEDIRNLIANNPIIF